MPYAAKATPSPYSAFWCELIAVAERPPLRHQARREEGPARAPTAPPYPARPEARTATRRSPRRRTRRAVKASTAGSARPSFRPDSRLSEWRTSLGTRGFVTTADDSTGSVGESRAPTRKRLGPAEIGGHVRHQRDEHACERHGQRQLAQRQVPASPERLLLHLEPVAEQDHDQRDHGEALRPTPRGVEVERARRPPGRAAAPRARNRP